MKKRTKLLITIPLGVLAVLALGGFLYFHFYFLNHLFDPGPIKGVKAEAWAQLKVGMTKPEVIALLGESHTGFGGGTMTQTTNNTTNTVTYPEFWEYTWTGGFDLETPSDKAHVVWFDSSGKVSNFRAPLTPAAQ